MALALSSDLPPMEARLVETLPIGDAWRYEPKWDGFRCLVFRDGDQVELRSKSGTPLGRYFPDVVATMLDLSAARFVLDGEIVIPRQRRLSFEALQLRLHPAESRVRTLAAAEPALYVAFDLLLDPEGTVLTASALAERRAALERFFAGEPAAQGLRLSPSVADRDAALGWLETLSGDIDGIVAKRADLPYLGGTRDGMQKFKLHHTADCVVGGFRYGRNSRTVGSLLLGLYDAEERLHHVGFTSTLSGEDKPGLTRRLEALVAPPGFTGRAPGGPSRWSTERTAEWRPLHPELVVEVRYDQVTDSRFRHGTTLERWRSDKTPWDCRFEQISPVGAGDPLALLQGGAAAVSRSRRKSDRRPCPPA